jgi:hypothetical protein
MIVALIHAAMSVSRRSRRAAVTVRRWRAVRRDRRARLYPIVTHAFNLVGRGAIGRFRAGDGDPHR